MLGLIVGGRGRGGRVGQGRALCGKDLEETLEVFRAMLVPIMYNLDCAEDVLYL